MGLWGPRRGRDVEELEAPYRVPPRAQGVEEGLPVTAWSIARAMTLRRRIGGHLKSECQAA